MAPMARLALFAVFLLWFGAACGQDDTTCLGGPQRCERAPMCNGLRFSCSGGGLFIGKLSQLPGGLDLEGAEGTGDDFVLQNDSITVVFDALGEPHDLAPTGGNIIDMGSRGGKDDIVLIYQISGILPDDTFAYKSAELIDNSPASVALVVRGTLDGRPDVDVVTRYELRACEPGLRIRTDLYNGSPDSHVLTISDVGHWGNRNLLPFAPLPGRGFVHDGFELLELQDAYQKFDYVMVRAAEEDAPTYGFLGCDREQLEGINSTDLSALGTGIGLLRPGAQQSFERFILATQSDDLDAASKQVATARSQLHGDAKPVTVTGNLVSQGLPFAGSVRRATVVISEIVGDNLNRPLTTIMPDDEGHFEATVPSSSWLLYEVWSFGRVVASGVVPRTEAAQLGSIEIEMPARLTVAVTGDGAPSYASLFVTAADEEEADRVRGTWLGEFRTCAPWLGSPVGASPACNIVNVEPQGNDFEIPAGRYQLWFTMGEEYSLARVDVEIAAGEVQAVEVDLSRLQLAPDGWLSSDLHVHGGASFDSSIPDLDRVRSFVGHGVDVIAATDHDVVADYANAVEALGVGDQVIVMGGLETTQLIPHLEVPDSDLPKVIGHFNHWPMQVNADAPRGGAPWDEFIDAGELFDLMSPLLGDEGIHMLNHPWDETQFGRDLGFLRAIGFDPREEIPETDDGTANGLLMRQTSNGTRNLDFHLIEVQNGANVVQALKTRPLWFSLISQGHVRTGVANSDSHELFERLGFGRTYVNAGIGNADFNATAFNRALKDGDVIGSNGVVITVSIGPENGPRRGLGFTPYQPSAGDTVQIEVRAPPWFPVDEVRVITASGERVLARGADLSHPADPLGTEGVLRFQSSVPLTSLVGQGVVGQGVDDWFLIEAGLAFQPVADLNDDGVPDTGDNNLDGVVDARDIEDEDEDEGPFKTPPDPTNASDPRYALTRVLPGAWPYGFTNPILIDWLGDGWAAPGLAQ
tara:strand:- start:4021 stop:6957 length:2937 start_codon:yes stop_codon:yes gene_type:complete